MVVGWGRCGDKARREEVKLGMVVLGDTPMCDPKVDWGLPGWDGGERSVSSGRHAIFHEGTQSFRNYEWEVAQKPVHGRTSKCMEECVKSERPQTSSSIWVGGPDRKQSAKDQPTTSEIPESVREYSEGNEPVEKAQ